LDEGQWKEYAKGSCEADSIRRGDIDRRVRVLRLSMGEILMPTLFRKEERLMKSMFRILVLFVVVTFCLSFLGLPAIQAEDKKTLQEEILQILKERKTITPEEYEELIKKVEEEKVKESQKPRVGFKRGFFLETPDGNFKLRPYLKLQGQFKAFEANNPANNDVSMRTVRPGVKGTVYKYYDFNVAFEFGRGKTDLWHGYMGFNHLPWSKLRIGQFKQPFSLDWYTPIASRDFIELPLPIGNLTPGMDIGVMLHGNVWKGLLNYGLSICNGTGKNTSDTNDDKDIVARLVFTPFNGSTNALLKGLHLGAAMTYGKQEAERNEMRLEGKFYTAGETVFFQINEDVFHDGGRSRYGAEAAWIIGPFAVKGEWVRMDLDDLFVTEGGSKDDFSIDGTYLSVSYILTGETQPFKDGKYGMIAPKRNLDPKKGTWGAIQLVARYETLSIDSDLFTKGYADPNRYTDDADGCTLGLNWYLNDSIRAMINYNRTDFDGHIVKDAKKLTNEDVVLVRIQLVF
jgi:phosphate-selective porin OprO/OprP